MAKSRKRATEIQSGERTQSQVQAITPVSLRITKIIVSRTGKPGIFTSKGMDYRVHHPHLQSRNHALDDAYIELLEYAAEPHYSDVVLEHAGLLKTFASVVFFVFSSLS
jgi:hypothetical protein